MFKVNNKDTSKTKVNCCSTFLRVWTNFTHCLSAFMAIFRKVSKFPLWYWQYFNADRLTNSECSQPHHCKEQMWSCQSYFKKFEVVSSRKQQSAIRTDSKMYRKKNYRKRKRKKIYSSFLYHICIMVTIF